MQDYSVYANISLRFICYSNYFSLKLTSEAFIYAKTSNYKAITTIISVSWKFEKNFKIRRLHISYM